MLYMFTAALVTALFLLDPSAKQFAFSLLPAAIRENGIWVLLLAAVFEFYVEMMWAASAHFEAYQVLTCCQLVEKTLVKAVQGIK